MKKTKEIYPPLQMIKDYNKKGRITWEQMDEMRTVLRKRGRYKNSDLAYITLLEVLFAMNSYDKIRDDEYENAVRIANIVSALASWRISKQVYRFNMDLELALYQQAGDDQIPVEVLKSSPYPCVYMESPNLQDDQYHGFFVYYDMDRHGTDVLKFLVLCRNGQEVAVRGFELTEGKTLRECIAEVLKNVISGNVLMIKYGSIWSLQKKCFSWYYIYVLSMQIFSLQIQSLPELCEGLKI